MMMKKIYLYFCLTLVVSLTSSCQFIQTLNTENIAHVDANELTSMLDEDAQNIVIDDISGWNHASYYPEEYRQLRLLSDAYHISATELVLNNRKHLEISTVLVRKLANLERQHGNGIKIDFVAKKLTFGDFKAINFDLLINAQKSVIPHIEKVVNYYLSDINDEVIAKKWLEELLAEPVKITFTLVGENYQNPANQTPIAVYSYSVSNIDEIVNLTIADNDLIYKWQQNHQEHITSLSDLSTQKVTSLIITLDTGNNKTLRSYKSQAKNNKFLQSIKEYFIELDITIRDPKITRN